ncbi:predicted protein [Aspergillus nidulans FGSC A4]|uniref:Uncharacterized protein n=1 Tax=Emericella nidulans (strain FGSC A4 / ATCC 38163 / CBS 112.46 / NRRL 194 / M139) TaxID=227321 RepID=Q5AWJ7_EMENI|nr:hypothetical protein [Aspergillus nidulans FGSC A4]EAA61384.1 predicted protein [Aspergillus nidulans FGSC A4]CBF78599.1 TPA: hypothetical protein ANIA_07333 [Aspergillus nidulans FGSC A4]|eukprot:XP_680602.1 predicted protein [Aspergillus nidulans FGSC A4]
MSYCSGERTGDLDRRKKALSCRFGDRLSGVKGYNLYYAIETIPGASTAEVVGDVPANVKNTVMRRFIIGPVAERADWNKERAAMDRDRHISSRVQMDHT